MALRHSQPRGNGLGIKPYVYTDCQGKQAQVKDNFASQPTDDRPQDSVLMHEPRARVELDK